MMNQGVENGLDHEWGPRKVHTKIYNGLKFSTNFSKFMMDWLKPNPLAIFDILKRMNESDRDLVSLRNEEKIKKWSA